MKRGLLILLVQLLIDTTNLFSQTNRLLTLEVLPVADEQTVHAEKCFSLKNDSICIELLKFYISGIQFFNKGIPVWSEIQSFHLIDIEKPQSCLVKINIPDQLVADELVFNLGIDSLTSVSGAFGADLDPTQGMYWTWQSGYINIKMEGKSQRCTTRNHEFQFHLGGYQSPFNACQNICLDLQKNDSHNILINFQNLFDKIDLAKQNQIMSPGKNAYTLSQYFSEIFSVIPK